MPTRPLCTLQAVLITLMFSSSATSMNPAVRNTILLANGLSIVGGIGLFTTATMDVILANSNNTALLEVEKQVAATSLLLFGVGAALSIVSGEMSAPKLVNRMDELATAFASLGFALVAAGVWSGNSNATLAGSVTVSSFYASRALLLPLIFEQNPAGFRPSDKLLLAALTIVGNIGGLLVTWSSFEAAPLSHTLLQAGFFMLGILNPVVFTGLTINLLRGPSAAT